MDNYQRKVLIIGLGEIGLSNAQYMTSLGLQVDGYDVSEKAVERALESNVICNRAKNFNDYDYYVICVSTHWPHDIFVPDLKGLFEIVKIIFYEGKEGALVGIESTIPPGTSIKVMKILAHKLHVVHFPHRYYSAEKEMHGVRQVRVLGGCRQCCVDEARQFYRDLLGIPLHIVKSIATAEMSKIVENAYRFVKIAFAEELKMLCDRTGVDFSELRTAVNTKWNIKILEARGGIGGHCLPKDSEMYLDMVKGVIESSIVDIAKKVDSQFRLNITPKCPSQPV